MGSSNVFFTDFRTKVFGDSIQNKLLRLIKKAGMGDRVFVFPANILEAVPDLPIDADVWWLSQFLDCFSEEEILSILTRISKIMRPETRLCIMETFWDRQRFEPAAFCLTMTSLFFPSRSIFVIVPHCESSVASPSGAPHEIT